MVESGSPEDGEFVVEGSPKVRTREDWKSGSSKVLCWLFEFV